MTSSRWGTRTWRDVALLFMALALSTLWYVYLASIIDLATGRHGKELFGYLASTGPTYLMVEFFSIWTLPFGLWIVWSMARPVSGGEPLADQ